MDIWEWKIEISKEDLSFEKVLGKYKRDNRHRQVCKVQKKLHSATDFEWLKQARFYWQPDQEDSVDDEGRLCISVTNVDFNYIDDDGAGDAVDDDCRTDFQPSSDFDTVTKLNIEEDSEILVSIECDSEGECQNLLLFTNGDDASTGLLRAIVIPGGLCLTGFILIPLGWILISINRGKEAAVQLVQNPNASMMPLENDPRMNQEMLTTDQLYKLVRGEMPVEEDRSREVPGPFANADTRIRTSPQKKVGGSINKASSYTAENPPTDESWKNWDES